MCSPKLYNGRYYAEKNATEMEEKIVKKLEKAKDLNALPKSIETEIPQFITTWYDKREVIEQKNKKRKIDETDLEEKKKKLDFQEENNTPTVSPPIFFDFGDI